MITELLLVRHGESTWNAAGLWQGQSDPPLSSRGREQALLAAAAVTTPDILATSPLARASQTADILGRERGIEPGPVRAGLMERYAGEWEGLSRDEIEQGWPGYLSDGRRPPGYESDEHLRDRSLAELEALARDLSGSVLAVTHGGVMTQIEMTLVGPTDGDPGRTIGRFPNLGALRLRREGSEWQLLERLDLVALATAATGLE